MWKTAGKGENTLGNEVDGGKDRRKPSNEEKGVRITDQRMTDAPWASRGFGGGTHSEKPGVGTQLLQENKLTYRGMGKKEK